jgi:hypothetical protein
MKKQMPEEQENSKKQQKKESKLRKNKYEKW